MRVKAAITVRRPQSELERLWQELKGREDVIAHLDDDSAVRFVPAPGDRGTEIHVDLETSQPGGVVGARLKKAFGEDPEQNVKDDLRRFKQVVETGEVVRSDGTPEGQNAGRHIKQRPAQPPTEEKAEQSIEEGTRT